MQGATGSQVYRWTKNRTVNLATGQVSHAFLHIPDCPYPLLGRDLLRKLRAQIHFDEKEIKVTGPDGRPLSIMVLQIDGEEKYRLHESSSGTVRDLQKWLDNFPAAWAETGGPGLAAHQPPVVVQLKADATPISVKQYPMSKEAHEGIKPHIHKLLEKGILVPCRSAWNTPSRT